VNGPLTVAVIGSRRRTDRATVVACIEALPTGTVIVSGGAAGPDTFAAEAARARGLEVRVFRPDLRGARNRGEINGRYLARNQLIVAAADRVVAFVAPDRRGGTEDAIRRAIRAAKPVEIVAAP
jgi:predicted Rossmann fold nucleotide-binding protein DprA/Smf involved in DNA uptake